MYSYIFSSSTKRVLGFILIFAIAAFAFDRVLFYPLFYSYNLTHGATGIQKPSEIFVVGSSHLASAIDIPALEKETGLKASSFTIPTSDMKRKYYAVKERLEDRKLSPPKIIVLEVSKLFLNKKRYESYLPVLMPYYHTGIMREYMDLALADDAKQRILNRVFHSYAFNMEFAQTVFDPAIIARTILEQGESGALIEKIRSLTGRSQKVPAKNPDNKSDPRIADWERGAAKNAYENTPDPQLLEYFNKTVELVRGTNTKLILLEPPFFRFANEEKNDGFENIRDILRRASGGNIQYMFLDIHNAAEAFIDVSHIDAHYRIYYTSLLAKELEARGLLPSLN